LGIVKNGGATQTMNLNFTQKIILAAFGIGIFFVQMVKFSDDGIEGFSWLLALLASVLLVLPAVGEVHRIRSKSQNGTRPSSNTANRMSPVMQEFTSFHKAQASIVPLLKGIEQDAQALHGQVDQWLGFDTSFGLSAAYMNMYEHVHQYCLAYCYGLTLLVEAKADPDFMGSERQKILMARVAKLIVECNRSMLKKIGVEDQFDEAKQRAFAMKDIIEVEKSVTWFIGSLASGGSKPDTELIRFLIEHLSVPEQTLPTFAPNLQKFTKQLMLRKAQAKKG
jgi:hypothetical protein